MSLKHIRPLAAIITVALCLPQAFGARPKLPPASKVEILAPAPGAELNGTSTVRIRITPSKGHKPPTTAFFGIGGGTPLGADAAGWPDRRMDRQDDTEMVPNGTQDLMVVTDDKRAKATIKVTTKNPLKVFFADLHSATPATRTARSPRCRSPICP